MPDQPGWAVSRASNADAAKSGKPVREDVICWRCYAKGSHYASTCVFDIEGKAPVVQARFEMLSMADKARVPWGPYLQIMGYLKPGVYTSLLYKHRSEHLYQHNGLSQLMFDRNRRERKL